MLIDALDRITDLDELRAAARAVIASREAEISSGAAVNEALRSKIDAQDDRLVKQEALITKLVEANRQLRRAQFGASAERFDPAQRALFEQAIDEDVASNEAAIEQVERALVPAKRRAHPAPKRQSLPGHLPRVEVRIEPDGCTCAACGGELHTIGEEVSERLDVKPAEYFVRRVVRPKLACRACETMHTPPALPAVIERGVAAPGLLAQVLVHKYADHLPLYRQSEMVRRAGVELPLSTLSSWVGAVGHALAPLVARLRAELRTDKVVHADETPLRMLDPGRGKTQAAYLFAYRRGETEEPPIIVYDYADNRSGRHARSFLDGYGGALVVDDYVGYKALFESGAVREIACWAHARRKFFELHQAGKSAIADEALTRIAALYAIEAEARSLDAPARHALRRARSRPAVEGLFQWLTGLRPSVNSGSGAAKAIDYLLKRKPAFTAYLDDGCFPIDNNPVENAIRPIALGRKNWLFAGSLAAGQRAAQIMSLIQTAKANGHDPMAYLTDVLQRLPVQPVERLGELLPHRWNRA
ncbi:MAG: IS66 family transposase [Burkholderiaceae bacterium]|jgi:transposase|nr:IS66 family transposase [Burkholderiaceae bacterium]